jgi:hypothetical protein
MHRIVIVRDLFSISSIVLLFSVCFFDRSAQIGAYWLWLASQLIISWDSSSCLEDRRVRKSPHLKPGQWIVLGPSLSLLMTSANLDQAAQVCRLLDSEQPFHLAIPERTSKLDLHRRSIYHSQNHWNELSRRCVLEHSRVQGVRLSVRGGRQT